MINRDDNPVQWVLWIDELKEAHEHLGKLIENLIAERDYDESRLRIDMGHVMAHLNRSWARRNSTGDMTDEEFEAFREYPQDLRPSRKADSASV
jgi:hypothetical protein